MEKGNDSYIHFLRPRRFGKTLFTSMLGYYYDLNEKDNFQLLFGNTYIGEHPTKERNAYHILRFDFSGLNTDNAETLRKEFHNRIYYSCLQFIECYQLHITLEKGSSASDCMSTFLSKVKFHIHAPIYVIVDEYDHFANDLLSFNLEQFQNATIANGFVRKFYTLCARWYEVLKTGTSDNTIGKIFITGVSPVTLDSITSGFNISTNLSLDPRFNEMMGLALPAPRVYNRGNEIPHFFNRQY